MNFVGTALIGLAILATITVEIWWTPGWMARIRQAISEGSVSARTSMYRVIVGLDWVYAVVAMMLMLIAGLSLHEIGFRWPNDNTTEYAPVALGILFGSAIAVLLSHRSAKSKQPVLVGDIDVLVPRTNSERRWFAATAVTAGVTEEVAFRAMPILFFSQLLPGTSQIPAVVVSSLIFGIAHFYQGAAGIVGTAVLGGVLGAAYIATDSLLVPMLLHALLDLRVLLLPTPKQQFEIEM